MSDEFDEVRAIYANQGIGGGRVGFGDQPAVLVVDYQQIYTRGQRGTGLESVQATAPVLAAARAAGLPVVYTYVGYEPHRIDGGMWMRKCPGLRQVVRGSWACAIDPLVEPEPGDIVIEKHAPSAFFGTGLAGRLRAESVDTVITCGTSTSGCVRATVVDGMSHDFRMVVPRECVADRSRPSGDAAIFDIDTKYGDVVTVADVLGDIERRGAVRET